MNDDYWVTNSASQWSSQYIKGILDGMESNRKEKYSSKYLKEDHFKEDDDLFEI